MRPLCRVLDLRMDTTAEPCLYGPRVPLGCQRRHRIGTRSMSNLYDLWDRGYILVPVLFNCYDLRVFWC